MQCHDIERILPDYAIDNVSASVRQKVAEHLSQCSSCSKELEALQRTEFLVNTVQLAEPPAGLWAKVEAQITEKPLAPERAKIGWNILHWLRLKPIPVFATAIIAFLVIGGLWWHYTYLTPPEPLQVPMVDEPIELYVTQHTASSFEDPTADKNGVGLMISTADELSGEM